MSGKTFKYKLFTKSERDFWKNLHINIDSFCDKWDSHKSELKQQLRRLSDNEIKGVASQYKIQIKGPQSITEQFITTDKMAIDFYCLIQFALVNPKAFSQLFDIPIVSGETNKKQVYLTLFNEYQKGRLPEIFIKLKKINLGQATSRYDFNSEISKDFYKRYLYAIPLLIRDLKKKEKEGKEYHFRNSSYSDDEWLFLILKETADVIFPAIPDNTRVLKGHYILITIKPKEQTLEVNAKSHQDAFKIRQYLSKKVQNRLTYIRKSSTYDAKKLFDEIISETPKNENLKLIDADFKENNLRTQIRITDLAHKNNILAKLHALKDKDILKLQDLSEFRSLTFYYRGINFKLNVEENRWGLLRLNLLDKSKPRDELASFKGDFNNQYDIPINVYLKNSDAAADLKKVVRKLFEKNTIEAAIPPEIEDVLLNLIKLRLANKPSKSAKRRCTVCNKLTWEKGDCPSCGNEVRIEGDFIDLKPNTQGIFKWSFRLLSSLKELSVKRIKKQIEATAFQLIDILDKKGNAISVYISASNVPEKIIKHYQETGSPLLIALIRYKEALHNDIVVKGFECIDIAELYSISNDKQNLLMLVTDAIESQNHKWQEKIIKKGYQSYSNLKTKKDGYHDQNFEKDIYNVVHELFLVGDRLGGKFAGVKAPDGIVSIQSYGKPMKRYCMAWDCKFSTQRSGYKISDPPEKHRKYIYALRKNDKIRFYGNLSTYAIISQNMNAVKYQRFYENLTSGLKWNGSILLVNEKSILDVYKFYKDNEHIIQNEPKNFYSAIHKLFKVIWKRNSLPYKTLSPERMISFFEDVETKYRGKGKAFVFNRSEFD